MELLQKVCASGDYAQQVTVNQPVLSGIQLSNFSGCSLKYTAKSLPLKNSKRLSSTIPFRQSRPCLLLRLSVSTFRPSVCCSTHALTLLLKGFSSKRKPNILARRLIYLGHASTSRYGLAQYVKGDGEYSEQQERVESCCFTQTRLKDRKQVSAKSCFLANLISSLS